MHIRSSASYRVLAALAMAAASVLSVGGCHAPRTNPLDQTAASVSTATNATSKLSRVNKADGSLVVDTNLPTYSSLLALDSRVIGTGADGQPIIKILPRVDSFGGGASHEMIFPVDSEFAALRSATVFTVTVDSYVRAKDGTVEIKGLRIGSDSAEANRSVADVAKALEPTWLAWSADQRAKYIEYIQTGRDLGLKGFEVAFEALQLLTVRP